MSGSTLKAANRQRSRDRSDSLLPCGADCAASSASCMQVGRAKTGHPARLSTKRLPSAGQPILTSVSMCQGGPVPAWIAAGGWGLCPSQAVLEFQGLVDDDLHFGAAGNRGGDCCLIAAPCHTPGSTHFHVEQALPVLMHGNLIFSPGTAW